MRGVFQCIACLETLLESERWTIRLSGKLWYKRLLPIGIWCSPCAVANVMKRNRRVHLKLPKRREKSER